MDDSCEPFEIPVDGTLDLHTFQPRQCRDLVIDYLTACREKGILQVRIIHGKGRGVLRDTVHGILARLAWVEKFFLAPADAGSWGATIVILKPPTLQE